MKVILAAGGSGGHIFPAVALAAELRKKGVSGIHLIASKRRIDRNILDRSEYDCHFLSVNPMPHGLSPVSAVVFALKFLFDAVLSLFIILRVRPSVVVGFGGYSSGAVCAISRLLGRKVLIHEQNYFPGRANRILSRIADRIAVSFRGSGKYFPGYESKVVFTGNPLRLDMLSGVAGTRDGIPGISRDKRTVLIMGGSQGSSFLNRTASEMARIINRERTDVQFIHLAGKKDRENVDRYYLNNGIPGKVFSFLDRIDLAYAVSDLAISRAGAAALFELAFYGKPMLLVPYPNPRNNQRYNAVYFEESGAAVCKHEKGLDPGSLAREVLGILSDDGLRKKMAEAALSLSVPEAGEQLAVQTLSLAGTARRRHDTVMT